MYNVGLSWIRFGSRATRPTHSHRPHVLNIACIFSFSNHIIMHNKTLLLVALSSILPVFSWVNCWLNIRRCMCVQPAPVGGAIPSGCLHGDRMHSIVHWSPPNNESRENVPLYIYYTINSCNSDFVITVAVDSKLKLDRHTLTHTPEKYL